MGGYLNPVNAVVGVLTGLALLALVINYPDVPVAIAKAASTLFKSVIDLANGPAA